jgi:hypothetical protein
VRGARLIVSACLSAVAVHFSDSYVHRLIDEMLRVEGDYLRERYAVDGVVPHPRTKHFYASSAARRRRNGAPRFRRSRTWIARDREHARRTPRGGL